jgi:hypothetical protein
MNLPILSIFDVGKDRILRSIEGINALPVLLDAGRELYSIQLAQPQ